MLSMRTLLTSDPFLPLETRTRIAERDEGAFDDLLRLGANDCEAAELLEERRPCTPCEWSAWP
jgi:hypothetical protein